MHPPSSSSSPSATQQHVPLNELITRMRAVYVSLPEELAPASRPSSPTAESRVAVTKNRIADLVNLASGDTTNPKWGYVTCAATLACTSRKYVGVMAGVRPGDGRKVSVGKKFKWEIPANEEDWEACAQRWTDAVAEEEARSKNRGGNALKASKYWPKPTEGASAGSSRTNTKADVIWEKVARWQANVPIVTAPEDMPASQETVDRSRPAKVDKGKKREQPSGGEKVQAALGFPVTKRSSVTSTKGGNGASSKPPPANRNAPTVADAHVSSPVAVPVSSDSSGHPKGLSEPAIIAQIAEVQENSFLPPSFPSQLQTSTPPQNARRRKPHPIPFAPCSPPPSSPFSSTSFVPSRPSRRDAQSASPRQPGVSPMHKQSKRFRSPNTPDDIRTIMSPQPPSSALVPVTKKARVDPPIPSSEFDPVSSGSMPVPPSTPSPSSPIRAAPVTPVSRGKGLGNAIGLPVPTTPNPHPLPNLTDLLASSRRSKPRPRPPSRKNTPQSNSGAVGRHKQLAGHAHATELPALAETRAESDNESSPTKTYFSSPASGSTDSPMSVTRHRPRSPISPLFTQHPSAFIPRFASTQRPGAPDDDDMLPRGSSQTHGGLIRGSSGFFGMGYSSQFDVEGHVEQVSELLERDVDFDGWLRDIDDGDNDDARSAANMAGQGHDAMVVDVDAEMVC